MSEMEEVQGFNDFDDHEEDLQRKSELEEIREKRLAYFSTVMNASVKVGNGNMEANMHNAAMVEEEVGELSGDALYAGRLMAKSFTTPNPVDVTSDFHHSTEEWKSSADSGEHCVSVAETASSDKEWGERLKNPSHQVYTRKLDSTTSVECKMNSDIVLGDSLMGTSSMNESDIAGRAVAQWSMSHYSEVAPETVHLKSSKSYMSKPSRSEEDRLCHETSPHQREAIKKMGDYASVQHSAVQDSVELDNKTFVMFGDQSTADITQLCLSTHRPSSDRSLYGPIEVTDPGRPGIQMTQSNQKSLNEIEKLPEEFCDEELRDLLGEDKYKEFLAKSLKDIEALRQERQASDSSVQKSDLLNDPAIMAVGSSLPGNFVDESPPRDENKFQTMIGKGQDYQPKLNRPKESPSLVQTSVIKTRGELDREIPQVQQRYGIKNYEQTTVPRKATFSSDQIYQQAYGSLTFHQHQQMMNSRCQPIFYNNNMQLPYQYSAPSSFGLMAMSSEARHTSPPYMYEEHQPPPGLIFSPHPPQNSNPRKNNYHASPGSLVRFQPPVWMPHTPRELGVHEFMPHPPPGQQTPFSSPGTPPVAISNQMAPPPHQVNTQLGFQCPIPPPPVLQRSEVFNTPPWQPAYQTGPFPPNHTYQPMGPYQTPNSQDPQLGWTVEQHGGHQASPSQQHIDGIRLHHENRRYAGVKPGGQDLDAGQQFAVYKLEKYFSSVQDFYEDRTVNQSGYEDSPNGKLESDFERTELDTSMDDELETLVASTIANLKVGGVTERLRDLGIDIPFLTAPRLKTDEQQEDCGSEGTTEFPPEAQLLPKSKVAKVCPECSSLNKPYMSWCASCGEVLIGIEVVKVKSKKHKGKKSSLAGRDNRKQPALGQNVQFATERDARPEYPAEENQLIGGGNQPINENHCVYAATKVSPQPQDNIDSGRGPSSSEERQMAALTGRTEREITEICQLIEDPIVKAFIKSYLKKKKNKPSSELQEEPVTRESIPRPEISDDLLKNENVWLHEAPRRTQKSDNMPVQSHGRLDNIDIEVFAQEHVSAHPSVTRNGLDIPLLDLGNSSDEEREKKPCRELELTFSDEDDDDIVSDILHEAGQGDAMKNLKHGLLNQLLTDPRVKTAPRNSQPGQNNHGQRPNSASRAIGSAKQPRSSGKRVVTSAGRPVSRQANTGEAKGPVCMSIEAEPRKRHWMRSSIAWSSYNPGELQRERSVPSSQWRPDVRGRRPPRSQDDLSSPDSDDHHIQDGRGTSQRPASADIRRRRTQLRDRASSAGTRKKNSWEGQREINLKSRTSDLRKVCGEVKTKAVPDNKALVKPEPGHFDYVPMSVLNVMEPLLTPASTLPAQSSVQTAYDRYHEMTPRIHDGSFSVWLCLPEEILLYIMSHLSLADLYRCAVVCKHFYRVAMDQTLWKSITLKKRQDICDEWLEEIGRHHPQRLDLIQCHGANASSDGLQKLFQHCGQYLEELNFSSCSRGALVGDSILLQASVRCKHLTHLDMSWTMVTDNGLCSISDTAHRLSSVCMNGCQSVSNHGLEHLLRKHGKSLRALELFGCFNINQKGIRSIGTHCHSLRTLNLGQCYKVTDSCITEVTSSLPRLESLDLRGCKQIKDNCIRKIVKNCPRLTSLALANCPHVSDVGLSEIATYLSHIRWIDLCGCRQVTDESLRALSKNCQNLHYIDISSTGCTRKSVIVLATFCCDRLEVVKLNFLTDIDEPSVHRLISNCKRLNTLQLYGIKGIRLSKDKLQKEYPQLTVEMG